MRKMLIKKLRSFLAVVLLMNILCTNVLAYANDTKHLYTYDDIHQYVLDNVSPAFVFTLNSETAFSPIAITPDTFSLRIKEIQHSKSKTDYKKFLESIGLPYSSDDILLGNNTRRSLDIHEKTFFQKIEILRYSDVYSPIMDFIFLKIQDQWFLWDAIIELDDPFVVVGMNTVWIKGYMDGESERYPRYKTEYWYDLSKRKITNSFLSEGFNADSLDFHVFSKAVSKLVLDENGIFNSYVIKSTVSVEDFRMSPKGPSKWIDYDVYSTTEVYKESEQGLSLESSALTVFEE